MQVGVVGGHVDADLADDVAGGEGDGGVDDADDGGDGGSAEVAPSLRLLELLVGVAGRPAEEDDESESDVVHEQGFGGAEQWGAFQRGVSGTPAERSRSANSSGTVTCQSFCSSCCRLMRSWASSPP